MQASPILRSKRKRGLGNFSHQLWVSILRIRICLAFTFLVVSKAVSKCCNSTAPEGSSYVFLAPSLSSYFPFPCHCLKSFIAEVLSFACHLLYSILSLLVYHSDSSSPSRGCPAIQVRKVGCPPTTRHNRHTSLYIISSKMD